MEIMHLRICKFVYTWTRNASLDRQLGRLSWPLWSVLEEMAETLIYLSAYIHVTDLSPHSPVYLKCKWRVTRFYKYLPTIQASCLFSFRITWPLNISYIFWSILIKPHATFTYIHSSVHVLGVLLSPRLFLLVVVPFRRIFSNRFSHSKDYKLELQIFPNDRLFTVTDWTKAMWDWWTTRRETTSWLNALNFSN